MSLPKPQTREFMQQMEAIAAENRAELESTSQSLEEIALLINQTSAEVDRLSQREMQIANRVRDLDVNIESYSRTDIRDLLRTSHEIELRLFMMRGQVEQLQERDENIREYQQRLRLLVDIAEGQIAAEQERRASDEGKTRLLRRRDAPPEAPTIPLEDIILAQENERLRMARKLTDGPAQMLANIILETEVCERLLERSPDDLKDELQELRRMSTRALQDSRRLLYELRPVTLRELGVVPTIRRYASEICRPYSIAVHIAGPDHDDEIPEAIRVALYRMLQEMIGAATSENNVSAINLDVRYEEAQVGARLEITGSEFSNLRSVDRMQMDEAVKNRLEQIEADLQLEQPNSTTLRLTLTIPLA